ncbi:5'-methylthioadenosine/adenosylhomocysteine nucleosidase [Clostridium formicaceticum]|uniref:adenosylhomocysteine nucleosidase n=1 Tax=Clostridium formicaceticum TaxID=1497 RepID=A0AAC9RIY6_9CLOT|nr:5'-methylthioadenosine/adenosylhomocysteine nucleosidase [Clostridium formicaceticum]AOY77384.1 5'-methylthioadenosine/S-adenosylhomocysteine nucleosidase [Clostridium formicaceticum]ARE87934.1 5'-methylthioadenosine/S-adenosylhomocysteine nucleosidase [Clostridium formicaceticum]
MSRIGIIGAMDEEVDILKQEMVVKEIKNIANMDFYIGILEGKDIVLVRCGIGKVNAAVCTQVLIGQLEVTAVINTGVAGAVHEALEVLDVVISTEVQQHDFDVTGFGYGIGEIPRMETSVFKASEDLVDKAYRATGKVLKDQNIFKGKIVSGDVFVSSTALKDRLQDVFQAYCTEMEGAAIGQTCYLNQVPFVIIRAMSDKADGSAHANFNEFVEVASQHSKEIVMHMLSQM